MVETVVEHSSNLVEIVGVWARLTLHERRHGEDTIAILNGNTGGIQLFVHRVDHKVEHSVWVLATIKFIGSGEEIPFKTHSFTRKSKMRQIFGGRLHLGQRNARCLSDDLKRIGQRGALGDEKTVSHLVFRIEQGVECSLCAHLLLQRVVTREESRVSFLFEQEVIESVERHRDSRDVQASGDV